MSAACVAVSAEVKRNCDTCIELSHEEAQAMVDEQVVLAGRLRERELRIDELVRLNAAQGRRIRKGVVDTYNREAARRVELLPEEPLISHWVVLCAGFALGALGTVIVVRIMGLF